METQNYGQQPVLHQERQLLADFAECLRANEKVLAWKGAVWIASAWLLVVSLLAGVVLEFDPKVAAAVASAATVLARR